MRYFDLANYPIQSKCALTNDCLFALGMYSSSDQHLEDMKFSTPMRSMASLMRRKDGQSEDSLSGYLTPPTSLGMSPHSTPLKTANPDSWGWFFFLRKMFSKYSSVSFRMCIWAYRSTTKNKCGVPDGSSWVIMEKIFLFFRRVWRIQF